MQSSNHDHDELTQAWKYAAEPWRVTQATGAWLFWDSVCFHTVQRLDGRWRCDCEVWTRKPRGIESCRHTQALDLMGLADLMPAPRPVPAYQAITISD